MEKISQSVNETDLPYHEVTRTIIGCAMRVHSALKNGFMEVVYQNALGIELREYDVDFVREYEMPIYFKNNVVGTRRVDFLVSGKIAVELKAVAQLEDVHVAQALNYLEAQNFEVGLLLNFGSKSLQFHRLFNKKYRVEENNLTKSLKSH